MPTDIILHDREIELQSHTISVQQNNSSTSAYARLMVNAQQHSVNLSLGNGTTLSGNLLLGSTKISQTHGIITNKAVKCAQLLSNNAEIGELKVCKGVTENLSNGKVLVYGKPNKVAIKLDGAQERVGIGTSNPGFSLHVEGTIAGRGPYMSLSDGRCKTQVQPIGNSVQTLLALQGVQFHWKDVLLTGPKPPKTKQWGFIAQEVEKVLPELVSKDQEGRRSVAYGALVPLLVEGIKEQQQQLERLEARLQQLESLLTNPKNHA